MSFIDNFPKFVNLNAIICNEQEYSYKDLYDAITILKEEIEKKITKGSVVSILGDYSFENIALFFALFINKNIIVPITSDIKKVQNDFIKESYTNYIVYFENSKLKIDSCNTNSNHHIITNLQRDNNSGLILFSSGSTGKPKAIIHNLDNLVSSYDNKRVKSLNMLVFLMFDHIGGLNTMFNTFSIGSSLIIPQKREPRYICSLIEKYKILVLPSSPTFLNLLLISNEHKNYNLNSLKIISYGTESMPQSLLLKLKECFPKVKLLQTFGTSETGIATTQSKSSQSLFIKLDDVNCKYKVIDGELYLKSNTQAIGYLNASMDSFVDGGWFKTGDLVEQSDGYLKIIGRSKEVINVGGQKVLPVEIESLILSMPQIEDCLVYGEKNLITGESVVCDVVLKDNVENIKKIVRFYCRDKIESFKIPTKVNVVSKVNFSQRFKKIRLKG